MAQIKYIFVIIFCLVLTSLLYSQKENLSVGGRYYLTLRQWYRAAQTGDWLVADKIASRLDPVDIAYYRSLHHPDELKKVINSLVVAPSKSVENWLELARIQAILGKKQDSLDSLTRAHELDPIRDDITSLYYQAKR